MEGPVWCHPFGVLVRVTGDARIGVVLTDTADLMDNSLVDSFEAFFRREYRPVLGLAVVLCRDRWAAEDVTQEAFIAAERSWSKVREKQSPEGWIRRVVANKSVSRWRRTQAEARALSRMSKQGNPKTPDPQLSVESAEMWAAVRQLSKRQAQVIALTYLEGMSTSEVGKVLGCSTPTVKTHLQRGRASLAHRFEIEEGQ